MNRPALLSLLALGGLLAAAGGAQAQVVATAGGRGDELSTAAQIDAWTQDPSDTPARVIRPSAARAGLGEASPWAEGLAGPIPFIPFDAPPIARTLADGRIHGEVGAEVGNRGHGGYAVASGPLGPNGAVQVAVSDYRNTGGRRDGYGYGYGNGDRKSLSVSAAFDFSRDRRAAPRTDDAAPPY